MIISQTPPILAQSANTESFPTMSIPPEVANAPEAQAPQLQPQPSALQRWGARMALPPAQQPRFQPMPQQQFQPPMQNFGMPPWMQGGGGYGGPPPWMQQQQQQWQPPQWAPPWMNNNWGGPPQWQQQRQMRPMYNPSDPGQNNTGIAGALAPNQAPQAPPPAAPQYRAPNGNTGIAGGLPQYNSQAYRPQPAGQVNTQQPQQPPPAQPNRQAAITPTPIINQQNQLA
jgi:hypothetical protein